MAQLSIIIVNYNGREHLEIGRHHGSHSRRVQRRLARTVSLRAHAAPGPLEGGLARPGPSGDAEGIEPLPERPLGMRGHRRRNPRATPLRPRVAMTTRSTSGYSTPLIPPGNEV